MCGSAWPVVVGWVGGGDHPEVELVETSRRGHPLARDAADHAQIGQESLESVV